MSQNSADYVAFAIYDYYVG